MKKIPLDRESILRGDMRKHVESQGHSARLMTDEQRSVWIDRVLDVVPKHCKHEHLWVFGYGSLIWNPAFHFAEKRTARVHGYHRRFCLWTHLGRGTIQNPGLMLGLDHGGSCTGLGFRIDKNQVRTELDILFRRELISHAYIPTWVKMRFENGGIHHGITFVIDRQHERYTKKLDPITQSLHIATAAGPLGPNREYLFDLVEHLNELGLKDRALSRLAQMVRDHPEGP